LTRSEEEGTITERDAWLAQTIEDPIDPGLPICDPHHHLWDRHGDRYLLDELMEDTGSGHNIVSTVFIDCKSMYRQDGPAELRPVGETEFVQGVANRNTERSGKTNVAAGIISFADLTLGDAVIPVLEAHMAASPRFRGIRQMTSWDKDPEFGHYVDAPGLLLDSRFREGFACLHKLGLSFDAWMFHHQLMELVDLAKAFPDTPIILDHIGTPLGTGRYVSQRQEVLKAWRSNIAAVADCPNVALKLGGLGMTRCGFDWHEKASPPGSVELAGTMTPYFLYCIEKFGTDRCMFESNFPVDKVSYSYNVMWNAFKRITADFSPTERAALFHDNAARAYRL